MDRDFFLPAKEAIEYGIVDKILSKQAINRIITNYGWLAQLVRAFR